VAYASKRRLLCLVQTPQGEGTGIAVFNDGKLTGGETVLTYTGTYFQMAIGFRLPPARDGIRRDSLLFLASTTWI
jgi:hypothetical protein